MKKVIRNANRSLKILLTIVMTVCLTSGFMQMAVDTIFADESSAVIMPEKEYIKANNLPDDTDYVLVIDKSGSLWAQEYNGEVGVFQKIRNSATQAFLRVAAGTNNRVAVVYFDKEAHEELGRGLTPVKSKNDYDKILGKLNNFVPQKTAKTEENASTNIAAGLECACDILESQGSSERKKCIILFSDGFNDLYSSNTKVIEKFREETYDAIFGTKIEGTSGERLDDGLITRIRDNKYELYCIYLENAESREIEELSKKVLEKLVEACRTDGESDELKKFYYVSSNLDEKDKYFDLAKQFSEVFYVSQNNSRHQDLLMEQYKQTQRSQVYVPNAAVSQLNLFLVNVPADSIPVLQHSLSGEVYDYVRDANEPEMVYYNISNPVPGDYELIIPGATDTKGAYAYYTDLNAVIDIEKTNGFGKFPIGQYSRVKVKCGFYDEQGSVYDFMDNEHFKLNMSLSKDGEEAEEVPMKWNGDCWETTEDIRIRETGNYRLTAQASLDNETINTLEYTKQLGHVNSMDVWVWITGILAAVLFILILRLLIWIRSKRLRDKITKEKNAIEKEKLAIEKEYKDINSKTEKHERTINAYKRYYDLLTVILKDYKEVNSKVLLKGLGVVNILDENQDYRADYAKARELYVSSYNAAINKSVECSDIDYDKQDSAKIMNEKYQQLHKCLEEVKKLKQEAKTKSEGLEQLPEEAEEKRIILHEAVYKLREMMDVDFNCGIEIKWPRQDERYLVDMSADEFGFGIAQLDDLEAVALKKNSRGKFVDVSFKEAIGDYETNIVILPYQWENGSDGIELQSEKDFGITDLNSNKPVKSCEPIDPNQPDGEKKYVARLEKGGQYRLDLHTDNGLGALTLNLKDKK